MIKPQNQNLIKVDPEELLDTNENKNSRTKTSKNTVHEMIDELEDS